MRPRVVCTQALATCSMARQRGNADRCIHASDRRTELWSGPRWIGQNQVVGDTEVGPSERRFTLQEGQTRRGYLRRLASLAVGCEAQVEERHEHPRHADRRPSVVGWFLRMASPRSDSDRCGHSSDLRAELWSAPRWNGQSQVVSDTEIGPGERGYLLQEGQSRRRTLRHLPALLGSCRSLARALRSPSSAYRQREETEPRTKPPWTTEKSLASRTRDDSLVTQLPA